MVLPGMVAHVTVTPGEPTHMILGGRGRTVKGHLAGRDSWDGVVMHFHPRAPHVGFPGDDEQWKAWGEFQKTDIGPIFFRANLKPNADGTFEIPGVLPGDYQFFVDSNGGYRQFTVEMEKPDAPNETLDLGTIGVSPQQTDKPPVTPKPSVTKTNAFGSVIERTLNLDDLVWFIDLDTGRTVSAREEKHTEGRDWLAKTGIDAEGNVGKDSFGLLCFDMKVNEVAGGRWDTISAAEIEKELKKGQSQSGDPIMTADKGKPATMYVFKTREGGRGILQITAFTEKPRGVKIRYKLVQSPEHQTDKPSVTPKSPATNANTFGPVIERVLSDVEEKTGYEALDLRTGNYLSLPQHQPESGEWFLPWLETNRVDFIAAWDPDPEDSNRIYLACFKIRLSDFDIERWTNATPEECLAALKSGTTLQPLDEDSMDEDSTKAGETVYLLPPKIQLPRTLAFQTREGISGLLQITGYTENPRGVKLRYKLVQGAAQSHRTNTIPEKHLSFGPATNGLCAALELVSTNGILALDEPSDSHEARLAAVSTNGFFTLGEPIEVRFHIRNVSNTNITVAGGNWRQDEAYHITIHDEQGRKIDVHHIWYSGITPIQRNVLRPGESVVFQSSRLEFLAEDADEKTVKQAVANPVGNYVKVKPGRYTVSDRLNFPDLIEGGSPKSGDWQGELETAPVTVTLR